MSVEAEERLEGAVSKLEDLIRTRSSKSDEGLSHLQGVLEDLEQAGVELEAHHEKLEETQTRVEHERRRYQEMFHFAPACYMQTDLQDNITDVNLAASRILRIEQQRLLGRSLINFIPTAERKAFRVQLAVVHDGQELHGLRARIQPRDTDPIPVLIDVVPARDDGGQIAGYRWLIREPASDRNLAPGDRARRAHDLLEAAPVGCFLLDRGWRLRFVNPAAAYMMGRKADELIGVNLWEAFPDAARGRFADIGHAVMANAEALEFEELYEPSHRWIQGVAFPTDDGVCVFFRDITKRKRAQGAEAQLAAIVRATSVAVFSLTPDGRIESWNHGAEKMFGYRAEEIAGRRFEALIPEDRKSELDFLKSRSRKDVHYDTKAVHRSGSSVDISVTLSPMLNEHQDLIGYSLICRDDSDHTRIERKMRKTLKRSTRKAEVLQEKDRLKDLLLVAASHDMRAPLATLLGMAMTLKRIHPFDEGTPEQVLMDRMIANGERLDRLLSDLLDLDRISQGLFEPQRAPIDVGKVAREVVAGIAGPDSPIRVVGQPGLADVDPMLAERIIENLIGNALKFSDAAEHISVEVHPLEDGVQIAVNDRGPGVPDEIKEEIFEPFKRGTSAAEGHGIGLTLVKRFAELHGGRAWVEDGRGGGASFRVFLPAEFPSS
jgi:PAS domain S-box-containing protein